MTSPSPHCPGLGIANACQSSPNYLVPVRARMKRFIAGDAPLSDAPARLRILSSPVLRLQQRLIMPSRGGHGVHLADTCTVGVIGCDTAGDGYQDR
jgi:hypothetical protein